MKIPHRVKRDLRDLGVVLLEVRYVHSATGFPLLVLGVSARVHAQAEPPADTELLLAGGEQTVLGSKRRKGQRCAAAVTVITEKTSRFRRGHSARSVALRSGCRCGEANRSVANVSIRGFNTVFSNKRRDGGRTLIYQNVYATYSGIRTFVLSRIKRIEIVRGSRLGSLRSQRI